MGAPNDKFIMLLDEARPFLDQMPLTDQHREILLAVCPNKDERFRDYVAVAVELGIPVGTVRSRLSRARAVVTKYLNDNPIIRASVNIKRLPASPEEVGP